MPNVEQTIAVLKALEIDLDGHFVSGDNIMIRCPFASVGGHKHTVDTRPSFGIRLTSEGLHYNCFTCARKGKSLRTLVAGLHIENLIDSSIDVFKVMNSIKIAYPKFYKSLKEEDDESKIERKGELEFTPTFLKYHKKRGVSMAAVDKFMLRYDRKDRAIIFPLYDVEGDYKGYVEKRIRDFQTSYINHAKIKNILYGESLVKTRKVIIVEGMYDVIRVYQFLHILELLDKYSIVGTIGSEVAPEQMDKIVSFANVVILMGDNDYAGKKSERTLYYGLRKRLPLIFQLEYATKDPAQLSVKSFKKSLESVRLFRK